MVRSSSVPIAGNRRRQHRENAMTTSRVQLALNVTDIDAATSFYRDLFGVEPAKQRPGYANFEVADPPLKLVLFHSPEATSPLNHLGVEVATPAAVLDAAARFASAGLPHTITEADRCCHAVQDKVWVNAPDVPLGAWEFYSVLADDPHPTSTTSPCCTTTSTDSGPCCGAADSES
jgi:catechol 2,3-dioxygenase-like lactoylglutathione lyase family enzyme